MRKLAILLGLLGAVGFAPVALAAAGDSVTIQCTVFPAQNVFGIQFNTGVPAPPTCTPSATSNCAQCINDLRVLGFFIPFGIVTVVGVDAESGYAGPYFLLQQ